MVDKILKVYTKQEVEKASLEYFKGDELAVDVWMSKYALKDTEGNFIEITPDDMHLRLAENFYMAESSYNNDISENLSEYGKKRCPLTQDKIFNYFKDFKYISPQGSIMNMLGNDSVIGSLSNCVVLPKIHDSYGGIMYADQQLVQLFKRRCGAGLDISTLRPKNTKVTNAAGSTTGAISFMERFSNTTREVGQCLFEDTLILTKNGLKKIKEIVKGEYVWTENEWVIVANVIKNKKKTYKITTKYGNEIIASRDHVFHSINGEKKVSEFNAGDQITMIWGDGNKNNKYISLINPNIENSGSRLVEHTLPEILDEDFAYVLGYMYGDGSFDKKTSKTTGNHIGTEINFACALDRPEIIEKLKFLWNKLFKSYLNSKECDGGWLVLRIGSQQIYKFLIENSIAKQKAGSLIFPEKILNSPSSVQLSFIAGYFDADGCVHIKKKGYIFKSIDKDFLLNIKYILSSFGILTKLHIEDRSCKNWQNIYSLCVVGAFSKIGFKKLLIESLKLEKQNFSVNRDRFLSIYKTDDITEITGHKKYTYLTDNTQFLSTNAIRRLKEDNINTKVSNPVLYQDFIDKIIEFEEESNVYDLMLADTHLFWANGFYAHNSGRRGALMISIDIRHPDIDDFIKIKRDLKKVTGANISVKLRDDFMQAVEKNEKYMLRFPVDVDPKDADSIKEINAIDLWNEIIKSAHQSGEPGLIFNDRQHLYSTSSIYPNWTNISTNPCIIDAAWIMTENGPAQVKDLINKKFIAIINGGKYSSTNRGFFYTGTKDVYKLTTKKGYEIISTDNHKYKKIIKKKREKINTDWVDLKNLNIGDRIMLNDNSNVNWDGYGNREIGWLVGYLIGDGNICNGRANLDFWGIDKIELKDLAVSFIKKNYKYRENFFGEGSNNSKSVEYHDRIRISSDSLFKEFQNFDIDGAKNLNEKIELTSSEFYKGIISGYFDADGTVTKNINKGITIRLGSINLHNLKTIQRMLLRIGIVSNIHEKRKKRGFKFMPDGKGGQKEYMCQDFHELLVSKYNVEIFRDVIGFKSKQKNNELENIISRINKRGFYNEYYYDEIKSIEKIGSENVYDCTINDIHEFDANGLLVHNCSEIAMNDDSCRLMVVNYFGCVENPFTENAKFNFEKLYEIAYEAQRLIDDLVDLELIAVDKIIKKINNDPEPEFIKSVEIKTWKNLYEKGKSGRRTGLGFTALGDTLAAMGMKYDSIEGMKLIEKVSETKFIAEFDSSIDMAIQRGKFKDFNPNYENKSEFIFMMKNEYPDLYKRMMKYGRRNISISTVAPVGSLSLLTQTTSGIEPLFMIGYKRRKKINPFEKNIKIDFVDEMGDSWTEFEVLHPKVKEWLNINNLSDTSIAYSKSPYVGSTAGEIDWVKRIKIQSIIQKFVTHSISSTINLSKDVEIKTVSDIYLEAWKQGLKGITVYRDGSRDGVLLPNDSKKETEFRENHAPKRPKRLKGEIHRFQNNLEKWIAVVGIKDGRPYELFTGANVNGLSSLPLNVKDCEIVKNIIEVENGEKIKRYDIEYIDADSIKQVHMGINQAFNPEYWNYAKLISGILRHGMPLIKLYELVDSLTFREENINTWKNGVVRVIKRYIKDGERAKGKCPECGGTDFIFEEGCIRCKNCSWSKCS